MTRREGVQLAALLVAAAALYVTHSFLRYATYEAKGYDLGIFDQVVRQYALFNAPLSSVKGVDFHILGDHFHPILALLAPFYWVWPDPRMLGVVMALFLTLPYGKFAHGFYRCAALLKWAIEKRRGKQAAVAGD